MAQFAYTAKHPTTREQKKAYTGFSWTFFFFGFWVSAFRGQTKWALLGIPGQILLNIVTFGLWIPVAIWMAFKFNEWHRNWLESKGYEPVVGEIDQPVDLQPAVAS
jgi:hypothetical protein